MAAALRRFPQRRRSGPDLYKGFNPWDRIHEPERVVSLLSAAGVAGPDVVAEVGSHPMSVPEDWWELVLGSGYRGTIERLPVAAQEQVRADCLRFIQENQVSSVETNVVYALARKPEVGS